MATRNYELSTGEYYHLYNRGTEKRIIFIDNQDKDYFLKSLYLSLSNSCVQQSRIGSDNSFNFNIGDPIASVGAYTLMPNHFHILVRCKEPADLSLFMNRLQTSYAMYFNKKYERSGRLFQGVYKSKPVLDDTYLQYLYAYIHLNPIKLIDKYWKEKGIKDKDKSTAFLHKYKYSSYLDYTEPRERPESSILDKSSFPDYFGKKRSMADLVRYWLEYKKIDPETKFLKM